MLFMKLQYLLRKCGEDLLLLIHRDIGSSRKITVLLSQIDHHIAGLDLICYLIYLLLYKL